VSLDVSCERNDEFTLVKASGEMDYHNFKTLKTSVEQALANGERRFIIDLADLAYLDSSALGSLLYNQKRVRDHSGKMVVIAGRALLDILNLTHLDSYFNIVESVKDGQQRLAEAGTSSSNIAI
jgi:anti-anti-sigma factor